MDSLILTKKANYYSNQNNSIHDYFNIYASKT